MSNITIISPLDQPSGKNRLLEELSSNLSNPDYSDFKFIVAYAKSGPLLKLSDQIIEWRKSKSISAIYGIDQNGTSKEAFQFSIENFNEIYLMHMIGRFTPTFHPKIYLFSGANKAVGYIGSNNLTVGGTEINFESYTKIEMDIPAENNVLDQFLKCWTDCLVYSLKVDKSYLKKLVKKGLVISETEMKKNRSKGDRLSKKQIKDFSSLKIPPIKTVPPSPFPKKILKPTISISPTSTTATKKKKKILTGSSIASKLVIQIIPHHNGEILLSKLAVNQNPSFFGWPFTGSTTPKKASNPSYPQRDPDPVIDLILIDPHNNVQFQVNKYNLNTVYYSKKSEIRITVPSDIVTASQPFINGPYPIMVMSELPSSKSKDYLIEIFLPGSLDYNAYDKACNQKMPSGGKPISRKFGWI